MFVDNEKLKELCLNHNILMVLLFGSHANGKCTDDSDVDLGLLMEDDQYQHSSLLSDIITIFPDYEIDITILNHSDPVLRYEVISNYKILYCFEPIIFLNFYIKTIKEYNDIQKFLQYEKVYLNNFIGGKRHGVQQCHPPEID
ncbi:nucleotidyltransferase domain-containing protein [Petroclostridium sp. X23]|uniref:type VII toxin-antitoxin system MntA family adenylyltransferase antitoxin n=1 Tax=Petroclostridium sp. X23 TaxID=3045146 RepID=UPI0024ADE1BB|nr:nucleotidyltransferase domain-containing protein [Petroclostridium sp. X23]WHH59317.1 nucleotidyltransferase domain-containing protein [Petroclostridium sp. X23]